MTTFPWQNENKPLSMQLGFGSPQMPNAGLDENLLNQALKGAQGAPDPGIASPMEGQGGKFGKMFEGIGGLEGIGSLAESLGGIGKAFAAMKQIGLAKDQLKFSKEAYAKNLGNQTQSYNTALEGRTRARAAAENRGAGYIDQYLSKHKL